MKTPANPQPGKRPRKKRSTPAQLWARAAIRRVSRAWAYLTEQQRLTWTGGGKTERARSRKGKRPRLSGQEDFNRVNLPRLFHHLPLLPTKPGYAKPNPTPVVRFNIVRGVPGFRLKLTLKAAPAEVTEIMASPPQSPGRSFCNDYRHLISLPALDGSVLDFTELYLMKFRRLPPGSKVFIRVRQLVGGRYEGWVPASTVAPGPWHAFPATDLDP